ncbi:putative amino acid permease [Trichinella spiralis]|uniref:putative amino acid permease n=1 Tax=Trichinella spiralis TaxID=6334 RepID=UPI0001EFD583|nr:putative amino acid permease [Trichinella spiralis]
MADDLNSEIIQGILKFLPAKLCLDKTESSNASKQSAKSEQLVFGGITSAVVNASIDLTSCTA